MKAQFVTVAALALVLSACEPTEIAATPAAPEPPAQTARARLPATFPAAFRNKWDKSAEACATAGTQVVTVREGEIQFFQSMGKIKSIAGDRADAVRFEGRFPGEGDAWDGSMRLEMSPAGDTLKINDSALAFWCAARAGSALKRRKRQMKHFAIAVTAVPVAACHYAEDAGAVAARYLGLQIHIELRLDQNCHDYKQDGKAAAESASLEPAIHDVGRGDGQDRRAGSFGKTTARANVGECHDPSAKLNSQTIDPKMATVLGPSLAGQSTTTAIKIDAASMTLTSETGDITNCKR